MTEKELSGDRASRAAAMVGIQPRTIGNDSHLAGICQFVLDQCDGAFAWITAASASGCCIVAKAGATMRNADALPKLHMLAPVDDDLLVVTDLGVDARFAATNMAGFYVGIALRARNGAVLGALNIVEEHARPDGLTGSQADILRLMAHAASDHLALHNIDAHQGDPNLFFNPKDQRFRTVADSLPQMLWSSRSDGYCDFFNACWYEFTGLSPGASEGQGWRASLHPDDIDRAQIAWTNSVTAGAPYTLEYRLRHRDGQYRWIATRGMAMRDQGGAIIRWFGTCTEIHDQKIALEERESITQELNHRIKNIFAVISGLIGLSARSSPAAHDFAEALRDRILALGRAHDFVGPQGHAAPKMRAGNSLTGLLREIFSPYEDSRGERVSIEGAEIAIDDRSATPLALSFHEIVTNAAKYGALSNPTGHVTMTISIEADDTVGILWRERGGPTVKVSNPAGFGTRLLDLSICRQLGGSYEQFWEPEGLAIRFRIPLSAFNRQSI